MKVKVISLSYIFQDLFVLCVTRPRYQVSVYRTIGPLIYFLFTPGQYSGERLSDHWSSGLYKSRVLGGINYKGVIMMGKLALRLCLISY